MLGGALQNITATEPRLEPLENFTLYAASTKI